MRTHGHRNVLALLTLALIALAGCGTGSSNSSSSGKGLSGPGIDAKTKTITIGVLAALSGPAAAIGQPWDVGVTTFWKAQNARGGIDGWKVRLQTQDDQYQPQMHVEEYQRMVGGIAMLDSFGSPTTLAIKQQVDQQKIVTFPLSWDSLWTKDPVLAPIGTPYAIDTANAIDYVVNRLGDKHARVGIIYQNDAYGQDSLRGYEAALRAYHFNDVARATYNVGDTDMTSQVQKMKNAGAQYVIVAALPTNAGSIVGTGASLGYNPRWIFQGPAWLAQLMTADGTQHAKPTPIEGALAKTTWVMQLATSWGDPKAPGMAQMMRDVARYAPQQAPNQYVIVGYAQSIAAAAILKKAIESGDLSRQGILNTKLSMGTIDLGGLVSPAQYTRTPQPSTRLTRLATVDPAVPGFLKPLAAPFEGSVSQGL
jgi:ABC-type branched-subunit amino acid transport system substrate-binding protein